MYPFQDSNGLAFKKKEQRYGPPLDYIGGKIRSTVEAAHENLNNIKGFVPNDLPSYPQFHEGAPQAIKNDLLLSSATQALHFSVISFLALYNMLGAAKSNSLNIIAQKSSCELKVWLDLVEREGSVLGDENC